MGQKKNDVSKNLIMLAGDAGNDGVEDDAEDDQLEEIDALMKSIHRVGDS